MKITREAAEFLFGTSSSQIMLKYRQGRQRAELNENETKMNLV